MEIYLILKYKYKHIFIIKFKYFSYLEILSKIKKIVNFIPKSKYLAKCTGGMKVWEYYNRKWCDFIKLKIKNYTSK